MATIVTNETNKGIWTATSDNNVMERYDSILNLINFRIQRNPEESWMEFEFQYQGAVFCGISMLGRAATTRVAGGKNGTCCKMQESEKD